MAILFVTEAFKSIMLDGKSYILNPDSGMLIRSTNSILCAYIQPCLHNKNALDEKSNASAYNLTITLMLVTDDGDKICLLEV